MAFKTGSAINNVVDAGRMIDNAQEVIAIGNAIVNVGKDGKSLLKFVTSTYPMERTLLFIWQYGKIGGHLICAGGKLYGYYYWPNKKTFYWYFV